MEPFVRSAYNYDMNAASDESGLRCEDESLAKQSFGNEVDINTIVDRFGLSGELPIGIRMPSYGDFTGIADFHSAVNAVALAHESFDAMPAKVRARFKNDPAEFLEFVADANNIVEARKLGLVPEAEIVQAGALVAPVAPVVPAVPAVAPLVT